MRRFLGQRLWSLCGKAVYRSLLRAPHSASAPTSAENPVPGGFKVVDSTGQSLAYVYGPRSGFAMMKGRTRTEAMRRRLLLAAVAISSLSVAALANEWGDQQAGDWGIRSQRSHNTAFAYNPSRNGLYLVFGCQKGQMTRLVLDLENGRFESSSVTYSIAGGPETTSDWEIDLSGMLAALVFPGDVLAFVGSLPNSGKISMRVELQDGPSESAFDLNGIDEVRQTLDDVCKLNEARGQ